MQPGDIVNAMNLSNAEGWNQTEEDWKLLVESPQNVCLLAECNQKIIGTTTADELCKSSCLDSGWYSSIKNTAARSE
jgi:hypothetical protein